MPTTETSLPLEAALQTCQSCACFHLRKATRLVTQFYDERLRSTGLRGTQFTLLIAIRLRGPLAVHQLAHSLVMDRTTLTRNLKPLQRQGLIATQVGSDRRVREILLTDEGHRVLKQAHPLWQDAQAEVARSLGEGRLSELLAQLSHTVKVMRDPAESEQGESG